MLLATETTDSNAQKAMETLTAQWYNAVVKGCGLNESTFQLAPGSPTLGTTSAQIWRIFDAIPPIAVGHYWNPSQISSLGSQYFDIVSTLKWDDPKFTEAMGDFMSKWMKYLNGEPAPDIPADADGGIRELFRRWSQRNMPADRAKQAQNAYAQLDTTSLSQALTLMLNAKQVSDPPVFAYNATYEQLQVQLAMQTGGCSVYMNSNTESSDLQNSWARTAGGAFFDLFVGAGSEGWDSITVQVAEAGLQIEATFEQLMTFQAGPLSQPSQDLILSSYAPWYWPAVMAYAYKNNTAKVWGTGGVSWANTFGPKGSLQYTTSDIVIVSGITVNMTSAATFDSSTQERLESSKGFGFFPFFAAESTNGWTHSFDFSDAGALNVTSTSPAGVPVILGVDVISSARVFGAGS